MLELGMVWWEDLLQNCRGLGFESRLVVCLWVVFVESKPKYNIFIPMRLFNLLSASYFTCPEFEPKLRVQLFTWHLWGFFSFFSGSRRSCRWKLCRNLRRCMNVSLRSFATKHRTHGSTVRTRAPPSPWAAWCPRRPPGALVVPLTLSAIWPALPSSDFRTKWICVKMFLTLRIFYPIILLESASEINKDISYRP